MDKQLYNARQKLDVWTLRHLKNIRVKDLVESDDVIEIIDKYIEEVIEIQRNNLDIN